MKEQYILYKSNELLSAQYDSIDREMIISGDCLLIMDMQRFFTEIQSPAYIPSSVDIIPAINFLMRQFEKNGSPIIATRHSNNEQNAGMMKKMFRHLLNESDSLYPLDKQLPMSGHQIIDKHQFDAFYETQLYNMLNQKQVKRVFICGVMIERCIESTARASFVRGFDTYVIANACATKCIKTHNAALLSMERAGIKIINSGYQYA